MLLIPATFRYLQRRELKRERQKAQQERDDAVRAWVEAHPAIKEMIESGTVPPPPNGTPEGKWNLFENCLRINVTDRIYTDPTTHQGGTHGVDTGD